MKIGRTRMDTPEEYKVICICCGIHLLHAKRAALSTYLFLRTGGIPNTITSFRYRLTASAAIRKKAASMK